MEQLEERFNPLFIIGKTRKEGIEYLTKYNIIYYFKSCVKTNYHLAIHTSYNEGTHFYKIYDFNSSNPDNDIILSFKGVQGKNIFINTPNLNVVPSIITTTQSLTATPSIVSGTTSITTPTDMNTFSQN